jgi:hypothetical protein
MVVLLLLVVLLASTTAPSLAQTTPEGASVALLFPGGTRSVGLGLTGVADETDPFNAYHNPATIHRLAGLWISGDYGNWPADRNRFDFAASGGARPGDGRFTVAGALRHDRFDRREIETSPTKVATGESWMTAVAAAGFGVSVARIGVGAALRWSTDEDRDDTMYDVGFIASGEVTGGGGLRARYAIGWSRVNVGAESVAAPEVASVSLEARERVGLALGMDAWGDAEGRRARGLGVEVRFDADTKTDDVGVGVEVTALDTVDLRYGHQKAFLTGAGKYTLGAGLHRWFDFFFVRIDYALATMEGSDLHSFGTFFGFDL